MKEVILLLTVLVMFIVCFFVMGKIGYFINENYKAFIIEERENTQSCKIISLDKISDEELEFVTGYDNMDEAKEVLFKGNVNMVLFTKGKDGAEAYTKDRVVKIPGNIVDVVDTTGAGDSFIGSFLFKLLEDDVNMEQLNSISDEKLREYLTFANAYAAYSTTKKGAIGSYATLDEIIKYMDK